MNHSGSQEVESVYSRLLDAWNLRSARDMAELFADGGESKIAGMVPSRGGDLNPAANTHHTLVVVKQDGAWRIQLFQNTPAQFHGRPELVQQMTDELRSLL